MRRKTRGALLNIVLFCGVLFLILYLNGGGGGSGSASKTFAWTTVRYKTTSSAQEQPTTEGRGVCPGLAAATKPVLVVARVAADGDTEWLESERLALAQKYHLCVYTADAPLDATSTHLQVPANRGHEAMAYLTFIIDNYDHIPAAGAVFVHGSRWAWHNDAPDYDNAALLTALNVSAALDPWGYHNLRCDWSASTCPPEEKVAQGSLGTSINAMLEPWNQRVVSDAALPPALAALFGGSSGDSDGNPAESDAKLLYLGRADSIRSQCCAQFVVARDSIWQHSRDEYVAVRQWLLDGNRSEEQQQLHPQNSNAAPPDDRIAGRILSYVWHILFLRRDALVNVEPSMSAASTKYIDLERLNTLACPRADECYCRLYGRCNLPGCTEPGQCYGQYARPPGFRLPDDWAATHS
jgi:hypothetical protein